MPVRPRRAKRPGRQDFSLEALDLFDTMVLRSSSSFELDRGTRIKTEDDLREAWRQNREQLLRESPPGTRPACWWRFEAPSQPKVLGRYPVIAGYDLGDRRKGDLLGHSDVIETQREALDRMNLLTDDERQKLEEADRQHNESISSYTWACACAKCSHERAKERMEVVDADSPTTE